MHYASTLYRGRFYVVAEAPVDWKEAREAGRREMERLSAEHVVASTEVHVSNFRPDGSGTLPELEAALPKKGTTKT